MPCGCQSTCGCNIIAGAGISVAVLPGGTFQIANTQPGTPGVPTFIQQTAPTEPGPWVWYELDGGGAFVAQHIDNGL